MTTLIAPNAGMNDPQELPSMKLPDTSKKTYEVIANTSFGRVKSYIKAVNPRQAAAITRGMLKKTTPVIKSIRIASNA